MSDQSPPPGMSEQEIERADYLRNCFEVGMRVTRDWFPSDYFAAVAFRDGVGAIVDDLLAEMRRQQALREQRP